MINNMPGGDRTGPEGRGPISGRGLGFCAGYIIPGHGPRYGRGWGRGFGRGYWGRRSPRRKYDYLELYSPRYSLDTSIQDPEREKSYLKDMVRKFEEEIKYLQVRIKDLSEEK